MRTALWTVGLLAVGTPLFGQNWVSLGGDMNSEIDLDSVHRRGDLPVARMRFAVTGAQGTGGMTLEMGAICAEGYLYIFDGTSSVSWSSRVIDMPEDVPEAERIIPMPAPNPAFTNFFAYLCRH